MEKKTLNIVQWVLWYISTAICAAIIEATCRTYRPSWKLALGYLVLFAWILIYPPLSRYLVARGITRLFDLLWELRVLGYSNPAQTDAEAWAEETTKWHTHDHLMRDRKVLGIPQWLKLTR